MKDIPDSNHTPAVIGTFLDLNQPQHIAFSVRLYLRQYFCPFVRQSDISLLGALIAIAYVEIIMVYPICFMSLLVCEISPINMHYYIRDV